MERNTNYKYQQICAGDMLRMQSKQHHTDMTLMSTMMYPAECAGSPRTMYQICICSRSNIAILNNLNITTFKQIE
eukprot:scaffold57313_cov19-Prasinocladus_malaysianus.AAC.2